MTAKIFRNAFLIGFTVLLACILLFFFIMYSNYQAQAYDILEVEAEHIAEGMQICGGEEYLAAMQSDERITWIAPDGSVLYDNMADADTMENHLQRPEVQEAFETGSGRSDRYSSTILEKNNYYARLLKDGTVLRVAGKQTSVAAMALMLERMLHLSSTIRKPSRIFSVIASNSRCRVDSSLSCVRMVRFCSCRREISG